MMPEIIQDHRERTVNVHRIVERILSHLPDTVLEGLNEVVLLDKHEEAFACYRKESGRIEIYLDDVIGFLRWILKKTYVFPYLFIGTALGHELDHHVNRNNNDIDKERSAEANAPKYFYPSLGIFKPAYALADHLLAATIRIRRRTEERKTP